MKNNKHSFTINLTSGVSYITDTITVYTYIEGVQRTMVYEAQNSFYEEKDTGLIKFKDRSFDEWVHNILTYPVAKINTSSGDLYINTNTIESITIS